MKHSGRRKLIVLSVFLLFVTPLLAMCYQPDVSAEAPRPELGSKVVEWQHAATQAVALFNHSELLMAGEEVAQTNAVSVAVESAAAAESDMPAETSWVVDPVVFERLIDAQLRAVIADQELTGDPTIGRDLPSIDEPMAQLGKKFFFTKALGGDMDSACASCHLPTLGGGDAMPLSIGVGAPDPDLLGPGRTHPDGIATVPRNAPTTFNIGMWDQVLFHDGRIESLGKTPGMEGADGLGIRTPDTLLDVADPDAGSNLTVAQTRFPITSQEEMRGFVFEVDADNYRVRDRLAARLGNYGDGVADLEFNEWQAECEAVFPDMAPGELVITYELIAEAMATYERSQVFVDNGWKEYVQGNDDAMSLSAKEGALLFYRSVEQGGAGCAECHGGDFLTDESFYALGIPQIGRGKGNGATEDEDFGRFRETGNPDDLYAFRTPTLLNVEVTGPYGHDGAYGTLEGIIRHHLNPKEAVSNYDFAGLNPMDQSPNMMVNSQRILAEVEQQLDAGTLPLPIVDLTDREVDALVDFMLALTDPCVKDGACLAPWMPAEEDRDPDGFRLNARLAVSE